MSFYTGKNVLVTGGTGLIGIPLVQKLVRLGAEVTIYSADSPERWDILEKKVSEFKFIKGEDCKVYWMYGDLEDFDVCENATLGKDYVFQLAGSKGSVNIGKSKAATFLTSHLLINLNMLKAAKRNGVEKYLLTSTVGVYPPNSNYKEEEVWKGAPAESDKYSAWAKRISELAAEAFMEEYKWDGITIVRPGNTYGPWDNFDKDTSMVVGALINRFASSEKVVTIQGNGSPIRDFTYADDIAEGMLLAMEKSGNCETFNLGIGQGYSIKELVDIIQQAFAEHGINKEYQWSEPYSDITNRRVLDIEKAHSILGYIPTVELREGIRKTVNWYLKNKNISNIRYNAFK